MSLEAHTILCELLATNIERLMLNAEILGLLDAANAIDPKEGRMNSRTNFVRSSGFSRLDDEPLIA